MAERVLLTDLGDVITDEGMTWHRVKTPAGVVGWADGRYLEYGRPEDPPSTDTPDPTTIPAQATAGTPAPFPETSAMTDREALIALYKATDGPNWANDENWLSDLPLDHWHGVYTDSSVRVVTLDLSDNQLSGEIPPEMG